MPYPNYPNQYQPYAPTYPVVNSQLRQQNNIIEINGDDGAKAYPMMPNTSVLLVDKTGPYIYLKFTDAANFPTLDRFKLVPDPITESTPIIEAQYATHEEVAALSSKIDKLAGMLSSRNDIAEVQNEQSNTQQLAPAASYSESHNEQVGPVQGGNDGGYQGNIRPNAGQSSTEW